MKDIFKKYHRHKVLTNLGILSISAILAISVNMFFLGWQTGEALKANVLEATNSEIGQDFIAKDEDTSISFSNSSPLSNMKDFSFSLAYNPELLTLKEAISPINGAKVHSIKNEEGFINYIITLETPMSIPAGSNILSLPYVKTSQETVHLNIINVTFSDEEWGVYSLTTEGIMF